MKKVEFKVVKKEEVKVEAPKTDISVILAEIKAGVENCGDNVIKNNLLGIFKKYGI